MTQQPSSTRHSSLDGILQRIFTQRKLRKWYCVEVHLEANQLPLYSAPCEYPTMPLMSFVERVFKELNVEYKPELYSIFQQGNQIPLDSEINNLQEGIYIHIIQTSLLKLPHRVIVESSKGNCVGIMIDGVYKQIVHNDKVWTFFGADGELIGVNTPTLVVDKKEQCQLHLLPSEQAEWNNFLQQHVLSSPPKKSYNFEYKKASEEEVLDLIRHKISLIKSWGVYDQETTCEKWERMETL